MKKVLVTGGCGFIGSHIVEHILENTDWYVVVLDALTYAGNVERLDFIDNHLHRLDIRWHDLKAPINFGLPSIDYVINCASESHVDRSIVNPHFFVENNVGLMVNVLDYVRTHKCKLVHVSSDEVYGSLPYLDLPKKENDMYRPSNPYSASKACQDMLLMSYVTTYGIDAIIMTSCNAYGERQNVEKFIPSAVRAIKYGETLRIDHAGGAIGSRMWVYVKNFADACLASLKCNYHGLKYHVPGIELDNMQVAARIADILKKPLDYHLEEGYRPGYDLRYALDGSELLYGAGWKPPFEFNESFEATVRYYEALL